MRTAPRVEPRPILVCAPGHGAPRLRHPQPTAGSLPGARARQGEPVLLRARGLDVTYVRNLTDIDDKILARARENGEPPLVLSRRMAEIYQQDIAAINCLAPTHEPRVGEHLEQIYGATRPCWSERMVAMR